VGQRAKSLCESLSYKKDKHEIVTFCHKNNYFVELKENIKNSVEQRFVV
jgi:hypothetical protein